MIHLLILALVAAIFAGACQSGEALTAPTTKCTAAQCSSAVAAKTVNVSRGVLACCLLLGSCTFTPTPVPPVPSAMGGSPSTGGAASTGGMVATGGASSVAVQFPACSDTMKAPSPAQVEQYRRTLKPRHKGHEKTQRAPVAAASMTWANVFYMSNLAASLDQLALGSCTGNSAAGCVSTQPFTLKLTETDAVNVYKLATTLDRFSGTYPPTDTGSDGASACKALVQLGFAKSCTSFYGYSDALDRVQSQPIMVGMNWYSSMFSTNNCGGMTVSGTLEGGHEPEIVGYDAGNKRVWLQNSWGNSWGVCLGTHCGYFYIGVNDLAGSKLDAEFDAPDAP